MWKFLTFCYVVLGVWSTVSGESDDALKSHFMDAINSCNAKDPVDPVSLQSLKTGQVTDNKQACLLACVYKETGLMDGSGFMSPEGANRAVKEMFPDNAQALDSTQKYIDFCKKVNEASVSDGDQGCERAALLFKCTSEYTKEHGLVV